MTICMHGAATHTPAEGAVSARPAISPSGARHERIADGMSHMEPLAALREAAAREERTRLARELHDSLAQTLYGIVLGARTTHALLERDPSQARQANDQVRSLAAAALAEVRALIFALPPAQLESEGLTECLRRHAHSLSTLHGTPVATRLCAEPPAPMPVKEAMYWIAREALLNALKHARSKQVEVRLEQENAALVLEVRDDGIGFDAHGSFPGHLGLCSMPERATRLGGMFTVESAPGGGTCIRVRIPMSAAGVVAGSAPAGY